eukprot:SAG11_NODE_628_length_8077_cov_4.820632_1_plen_49_part_10
MGALGSLGGGDAERRGRNDVSWVRRHTGLTKGQVFSSITSTLDWVSDFR